MIKAVLFDWYGVICNQPYLELVQLHSPYDEPKKAALLELGDQVNKGDITLPVFYALVGVEVGHSADFVKRQLASLVRIDRGVTELVEVLRFEKLFVGIAANANKQFLNETLSAHGISHLFDEVVTSSDVKVLKPSLLFFDAVLKAARSPGHPERCACVDATLEDALGASRHGLMAFLFESAPILEQSLKMARIL